MVYSGFFQGGDEFIVKLGAFAGFDGAVIGDQGIASFYDMRFDDYWVNDLVSWQCEGADVDVINHDVLLYCPFEGWLSWPEVNALLMNKLPEALTEKQKLSKIGNLLMYLRKNGKIELLENKMWARKFS